MTNDFAADSELTSLPAPGVIAGAAATLTSETLQHEFEKLQEDRTNWERWQEEESHRLRNEGALLQAAWQRLEEEQRRILAEKEIARRTGGQQTKSVSGVANVLPPDSSARATPGDNRMAWMQMQRMRRDIQNHRRSHGDDL